MPILNAFSSDTIWARFEPTEADWETDAPVALVRMLEQLHIIRHFEEKVLQLKDEQLLHGPAHSSIGQEGGAVGCMSALGANDKINGTHRMHHQFLAKSSIGRCRRITIHAAASRAATCAKWWRRRWRKSSD